jgi:hypothetical protein
VNAGEGLKHVEATRGKTYAFLYIPQGDPVTVRLGKISGEKVRARWFDPREGTATDIGEFANEGTREFTPPAKGSRTDWVLVLDEASKDYSL